MKRLTHVDEKGRGRMVDVSEKPATRRIARAVGRVMLQPETISIIRDGKIKKGDPLETARIAGILAAKQTPSLIPLCHQLLLEHIDVSLTVKDKSIVIESIVITTGKTGAEMEALTAVSVAALTIYDMCKGVEKGIVIEEIVLQSKSGGKSGDYQRASEGRM